MPAPQEHPKVDKGQGWSRDRILPPGSAPPAPLPRTGDELPVGRPGDAGLGAALGGTRQLQPLAPAQGDVCGQAGEAGQGVDGEGEPADGPPGRVHRGAGIAAGVPFLHEERQEEEGWAQVWGPAASLLAVVHPKSHSSATATFSSPR